MVFSFQNKVTGLWCCRAHLVWFMARACGLIAVIFFAQFLVKILADNPVQFRVRRTKSGVLALKLAGMVE
jgi:hypothetical protein